MTNIVHVICELRKNKKNIKSAPTLLYLKGLYIEYFLISCL